MNETLTPTSDPVAKPGLRQFAHILLAILITLGASLTAIMTYTKGGLDGDFSHHVMPAERWGIPAELKEKGFTPMYYGKTQAGWDGQFYYYMANDVFAQKDAAAHMDADAYRYQRIGLPLIAKAASLLVFQSWVSPLTYYLTSLLLVLGATVAGGWFFSQRNISPYWMLPWALGLGTQLTMLNGLPDAAADALMIMAFVALVSRRHVLYCIAATLGALSREAYILFPAVFLAVQVLLHFNKKGAPKKPADWVCLALPLLLFLAWQTFVRQHFGSSITAQINATNILGLPFASTLSHLLAGMRGAYPGMLPGYDSYLHGLGILSYVALFGFLLYQAVRLKPAGRLDAGNALPFSFSASLLLLLAIYACFGQTVMWHFSGYMKSANLFLFLLPFLPVLAGRKPGAALAVLLVLVVGFMDWQGWNFRVSQSSLAFNRDISCEREKFTREKDCKERFIWFGRQLPGQIGKPNGVTRAAAQSEGNAFVTYGPYIDLPAGKFKVSLSYSATKGVGPTVGFWDIGNFSNPAGAKELFKQELPPPQGETVSTEITVPEPGVEKVEVRVYTHGQGPMAVKRLEIERLSD